PRRADPRHGLLVPPTHGPTSALAPARRRAPASPPHAPRSRAARHGRDPVVLDRAAVGRRARADLLPQEREQRAGALCRGRARPPAAGLVPPRDPVETGAPRAGSSPHRPAGRGGRRRPRRTPPPKSVNPRI